MKNKKFEYCKILNIPEEITLRIPMTMKVERIVDKLQTYKKLGIQVIYVSGEIKKLTECREFLCKLSKEVSIFLTNPEICPPSIKQFIENV